MALFTLSPTGSCPTDRPRPDAIATMLILVAFRDSGKDDLLTGGLNNRHTHIGNLHLRLTFSDIQPEQSDLFN
jgi:hypothetical protein